MVNMNFANRVLPDLNLLRVFLTIWDTRNLTVAGQRLSLTQPAVSHALRRLRETFNDPLFIRVTGSMVPTDMAARLHGPFTNALQLVQHAVQNIERFDPLTARRVFRLAMSDISEFFFLPALMGWLATTAPDVHVKVVPLEPTTVAQAMRAGEVDLTIGFVPDLEEEGAIGRYLFTDAFVCLVRAEHPITRASGAPDLGALKYVYASTNASGHHHAERWLTEIGLKRQVALRLGHFTVAPSVVRDTDLAVIFPESVARLINETGEFALLDLPPGQPRVEIRVHTHPHFSGDAGIQWLRDSLGSLFADGGYPAAARAPMIAPSARPKLADKTAKTQNA